MFSYVHSAIDYIQKIFCQPTNFMRIPNSMRSLYTTSLLTESGFFQVYNYIKHCFILFIFVLKYEGWNFNSGNYLFTTDTK